MAAMSIATFFAGKTSAISFGRGLSRQLLVRPGAISCAFIPHKGLILTSSAKNRVYGPEALNVRKDEVHHWTNGRYVAIALIPIIPAAIVFPNMVMDTALCSAMLLHTHWGLSGVAQDYIHGNLYAIFKYAVLFFSITSFGSLCYFNYTDIGFARAARLIFQQL